MPNSAVPRLETVEHGAFCFPCFGWFRSSVTSTSLKRDQRHSRPTEPIRRLTTPPPTEPIRRLTTSKPKPPARIDIFKRSAADQPHHSFFKLPPELRLWIYEELLGRRVAQLVWTKGILRAKFFVPVEDPQHNPQRLIFLAEKVTTAILLSCRQTYHEALPVLYGQNTFYCSVGELAPLVRIGLGTWCLPYIHSIDLDHNFPLGSLWGTDSVVWDIAFALLQQMNLKRLVFRFEVANAVNWTERHPRVDTLYDTEWADQVLGLRSLLSFALFLRDFMTYEYSVPDVAQEMRNLLIGPQAEDKYREYLERENRIVHVVDH
ncbi:hypothetical protein R3P38DRAFT_2698105 [Favolaschia claudopus]|uniref:DUF7730 domain-containing protein n=1 Tax=Favolaschia claudopus TaxID=2862362 RepID=A0AAW0CB61_9AGAR